MTESVRAKFEAYPEYIKPKMEELRSLIMDVAEENDEIGEIEETLKWGEPAYITSKPKSGTTVRIDWKSKNPSKMAVYVNCQTDLVKSFKNLIDDGLEFEGTRAVLFPVDQPLPKEQLSIFIKMALRYHIDKNK